MTTTTKDKYTKINYRNIYVLKIVKNIDLIWNRKMALQIKLIQKKETLQIIRSVSPNCRNWYDKKPSKTLFESPLKLPPYWYFSNDSDFFHKTQF